MKFRYALTGAVLVTSSALALAQQGPESLLPKAYEKPAPRTTAPPPAAPPPPEAGGSAHQPGSVPTPPVAGGSTAPTAPKSGGPSLDRLVNMSPEELAQLLSSKPKVDMPPAARRAMKRVGIIDANEGGLPYWSIASQNPSLVRAALGRNSGQIVSRWGHILLRRALASRLDAPAGMDPAEFAALRAALLVRMGEADAARELAQDIDVANYSLPLVDAALDSYVLTGDLTGACPLVLYHGGVRKDRRWQVFQGLCNAYNGDLTRGMQQLDRIAPGDGFEAFDLTLARKFAGAAGRGGRAVTIEWKNVEGMNPWRFATSLALGLTIPEALVRDTDPRVLRLAATLPAAPFDLRAAGADLAGGRGILSSAAMVDLYSQIYAAGGAGAATDRAAALQNAYLADQPSDRLSAIKTLWEDEGSASHYSRQVLTAYAAARLPAAPEFSDDAAGLIAAMLSAGLDANAMKWAPVVPDGSIAWGLLAVAQPNRQGEISAEQIARFNEADESTDQRKTRFLVAGLAALGRLPMASAADIAEQHGFELDRPSRWTQMIDAAAATNNPTLVAMLAGLGMQGDGWNRMTARNLFHIVAALNRVGLGAEARMIAAEAVARG